MNYCWGIPQKSWDWITFCSKWIIQSWPVRFQVLTSPHNSEFPRKFGQLGIFQFSGCITFFLLVLWQLRFWKALGGLCRLACRIAKINTWVVGNHPCLSRCAPSWNTLDWWHAKKHRFAAWFVYFFLFKEQLHSSPIQNGRTLFLPIWLRFFRVNLACLRNGEHSACLMSWERPCRWDAWKGRNWFRSPIF